MYNLLQTVFAATRPAQTFFKQSNGEDEVLLFIPAALAVVSALVLFLRVLSSIHTSKRSSDIILRNTKISELNAKDILPYKILRLLSSLVLLGLSGFEVATAQTQTQLILISFVCFYTYATVLSFSSLTASTPRWRAVYTQHVASLYIVVFAIHAYRTLKPLTVYGDGNTHDEQWLVWVRFGLLGVVGAFIPLFVPRSFVPTMSYNIPSPQQTACYFSLLFYSYLDRVIIKAYGVLHLSVDELPVLRVQDSSAVLTAKAFPYIDPVVIKKQSHIFWRLLIVFRWDYFIMAQYQIAQTLIQFLAPFSLKKLLEYLETDRPKLNGTTQPWVWVTLIAFGPIASSLAEQRFYISSTRVMMHLEAILTQLVFEHSLRIRLSPSPLDEKDKEKEKVNYQEMTAAEPIVTPPSEILARTEGDMRDADEGGENAVQFLEAVDNESESDTVNNDDESHPKTKKQDSKDAPVAATKLSAEDKKPERSLIGTMTNLVTTDLEIIKMPAGHFLIIPFAIFQIILSVLFLYMVMGWSAVLGMLTTIITLPVPALLGKLLMKTQKGKMEATDSRVQLVTQNLNVMRMIKLFAWEPKVKEQISELREDELRLIKKGRILDLLTMYVRALLPLLAMVVTYATYTLLMKQELSASVVFSSMAVFQMFQGSLQRLFFILPALLRAKVSLDRFNTFFAKTELLETSQANGTADALPVQDIDPEGEEIVFYPSTYTWTKDEKRSATAPTIGAQLQHRFVLHIDEKLTFQRNVINLIVGPTASGKTSVLMALLGEYLVAHAT
ncbi:hypothetical protein PILCRDRAFT_12326 [Piloderma croceum F 1598]|uniref:ABC transmembrane type-1 domain-containing protein n=1 Tax=Piloderma croceum (strain F 1598) TaxID=765440 RepID=A0A0C3FBE5_PILCF|nr:hypothetical protein PILCRDRAFT_12326 [Piloderma croceum F 1598]